MPDSSENLATELATDGVGTEDGAQTEPPGPPLPLAGRAKVLVIVLALAVLGDFVAGLFDLAHYGLLGDLDAGEDVSVADADASDNRVYAMALVTTGLLVVSTIAFLVWFFRAYSNLPRLGVAVLRYKRGWSIGSWFIPILNLFRPKQIANDIWRGSDPELPATIGRGFSEKPVPGLMNWWWGVWLVSGWLGTRAAGSDLSAGTIDEQKTATGFYIAADFLSVAAGILVILVVRAITARQEARREMLTRQVELAG